MTLRNSKVRQSLLGFLFYFYLFIIIIIIVVVVVVVVVGRSKGWPRPSILLVFAMGAWVNAL